MADDAPYLVVSRKLAEKMKRDPRLAEALNNIGKAAAKLMMGPKTKTKTPSDKCPLCKRGTVQEDSLGAFCSRRYAKRKPCAWWVIA